MNMSWKLLFVMCMSIACSTVFANRYVLMDLEKKYAGTAGFKADPKTCQLYLENLNYFAKKKVSLLCGRPIAPHLSKRIQELEWEDIEPDDHQELIKQVALLRGEGTRNTDLNACNIRKKISTSPYLSDPISGYPGLLQRSKFFWHGALVGNEDDDRDRNCEHTGEFHFVRYSENSPKNNDVWPCERLSDDSQLIFNNDPSLFIVDSAMNVVRELDSPARSDPRNTYEGQAMRYIDKKLYWEIAYDGELSLYRVNPNNQFNMELACEFKLVKQKRRAQTSRK